jgi:ribosomal-protein-alanine N-acetyltransferase
MRPTLRTARLSLRPLAAEDAVALHRLWNDAEVGRFLFDGKPVERDLVDAEIAASDENFERHGYGLWAICTGEGGPLDGFCGFHFFQGSPSLQLVYALDPRLWGRGLATEAACEALRYGVEALALDEIVASADAPNAASLAVMERCGMRFRRREEVRGRETVFYAITKREWDARA